MDEKIEIKKISLNQIKRGGQQREKLTPLQEQQTKAIHKMIGEPLLGSFEQFEFNFSFDIAPDTEIAIWGNIALSLNKWRQINPLYTAEKEKEVYGKFLEISMGMPSDKELEAIYMSKEK